MKYALEFGLVALVLTGVLYVSFYTDARLPIYIAWLVAANITTLLFYGMDKGLARIRLLKVRVPELILNLLAIGGGFLGAWLGSLLFRHKVNLRKHQGMYLFRVLSTLLHAGGIYLWVTYWR